MLRQASPGAQRAHSHNSVAALPLLRSLLLFVGDAVVPEKRVILGLRGKESAEGNLYDGICCTRSLALEHLVTIFHWGGHSLERIHIQTQGLNTALRSDRVCSLSHDSTVTRHLPGSFSLVNGRPTTLKVKAM